MLSLSSNWVSGEFEFADLVFFFNSGSFTWSRLKSSTHQFPGKWYPILDPNYLISIPSPKLNGLKNISFTTAHTYVSLYMAVPPPHTPLIQATVDQLLFLNANGFHLCHVNTIIWGLRFKITLLMMNLICTILSRKNFSLHIWSSAIKLFYL